MKKIVFTFLCVLLIFNSGCKKKEEDTKVYNSNFVENNAANIIKELYINSNFSAMRTYNKNSPNSEDVLRNYYGIENPDIFSDFSIMISHNGGFNEIAVFIMSEGFSQPAFSKAVEAVEARYNQLCQGYILSAQYEDSFNEDFSKSVIVYDNAIVLCFSGDYTNETVFGVLDGVIADSSSENGE